MRPKVIIHNSISIDGSLSSFEPNMELHYRIAGMFKPQIHLIGSNTIIAGIKLYGDGVPPEVTSDFKKPSRSKTLPLWVVVDSTGKLEGLLHTCRQFEQCRDVIVLVSQTTPQRYLRYLNERQYEYHCVGKNSVDLHKALDLLSKNYHAKIILTDTGRILGNLLLCQGLVDEISLLIHSVIVGEKSYGMFQEIEKNHNLTLVKYERLEKQYIWLLYKIKKRESPRTK
jgi:2,5-diamino-6-(ribosylamino)-4(3H)-pyrimidinone 5'-phosphate reductase